MEVHRLEPTMTVQSIISWKNIIKRFITDNGRYENFLEAYLNDDKKIDNIRHVYGENVQLDSADIRQTVKLYAEMNILANALINEGDKNRAFIATSKRCSYLCELYIRFARTKGYDIYISGTYRKIYHLWKLLDVNDDIFYNKSLSYILKKLNQIIKDETLNLTEEIASSDSETGSVGSNENSTSHNVNKEFRSIFKEI
ncbi:hypothetical protein RclHR1_34090001 [Rhizophagus clarus]|nr:hypothetical protein RclHR1_34090001 [Rhizophagus clarus]